MRKLTKVRECNRGFGLLYVNAVNPEMPLFVCSERDPDVPETAL
jgi:hypothetical protein